ncbi:hypothetical protein RIF29_29463 [Crotalaria pallida]|uniref:Large ribosomal subunit protein bL25 beta domain-containing protein n=1 Tax=Crotalaria pallida TaxID=3830 RepID=A0AAN9I0E8_CROPI
MISINRLERRNAFRPHTVKELIGAFNDARDDCSVGVIILTGKIHKDKESGKILTLVFAWAEDGMELKVDVPVIFKGEDVCLGIKKGGILNRIRPSLKYLCPSEHIPSKIEVDVSKLDIEDRIFMRDIEIHPSLKLLSKN